MHSIVDALPRWTANKDEGGARRVRAWAKEQMDVHRLALLQVAALLQLEVLALTLRRHELAFLEDKTSLQFAQRFGLEASMERLDDDKLERIRSEAAWKKSFKKVKQSAGWLRTATKHRTALMFLTYKTLKPGLDNGGGEWLRPCDDVFAALLSSAFLLRLPRGDKLLFDCNAICGLGPGRSTFVFRHLEAAWRLDVDVERLGQTYYTTLLIPMDYAAVQRAADYAEYRTDCGHGNLTDWCDMSAAGLMRVMPTVAAFVGRWGSEGAVRVKSQAGQRLVHEHHGQRGVLRLNFEPSWPLLNFDMQQFG